MQVNNVRTNSSNTNKSGGMSNNTAFKANAARAMDVLPRPQTTKNPFKNFVDYIRALAKNFSEE